MSSTRRHPLATRVALAAACLAILVTYLLMVDLKGISTDEGQRIWAINGGKAFTVDAPPPPVTWAEVIQANSITAYPPLYFLMQNTLMRAVGKENAVIFRLGNIFFLWVCLQGLIALTAGWRLVPRLFLLVLFSLNAYLFMHVLQIREYIVGVAFYIWSTWLVLRLDARRVTGGWRDVAWFAGYGGLLVAGFYVQSWVVFPAVGQCLFLLARRRADWFRYYAHLALSYLIVVAATWPYVTGNHQKVDIGRWGTPGIPLGPQLKDGFHLVLTGHLPGQTPFTDFLFWFWLAVLAGGAGLFFFRGKLREKTEVESTGIPRAALLPAMCIAVSGAFQIVYFFKVDTLSVWPRYFIIHYFFLTWLIALSFKSVVDLGLAETSRGGVRRGLLAVAGAIGALALVAGVCQARSYQRFPYLDTGFSRESNGHTVTAGMAAQARPGDVFLVHDFVVRATLALTRALPGRMLLPDELADADLSQVNRVIYLESNHAVPERAALGDRLTLLGFTASQEVGLHTADGKSLDHDWRLIIFARP